MFSIINRVFGFESLPLIKAYGLHCHRNDIPAINLYFRSICVHLVISSDSCSSIIIFLCSDLYSTVCIVVLLPVYQCTVCQTSEYCWLQHIYIHKRNIKIVINYKYKRNWIRYQMFAKFINSFWRVLVMSWWRHIERRRQSFVTKLRYVLLYCCSFRKKFLEYYERISLLLKMLICLKDYDNKLYVSWWA